MNENTLYDTLALLKKIGRRDGNMDYVLRVWSIKTCGGAGLVMQNIGPFLWILRVWSARYWAILGQTEFNLRENGFLSDCVTCIENLLSWFFLFGFTYAAFGDCMFFTFFSSSSIKMITTVSPLSFFFPFSHDSSCRCLFFISSLHRKERGDHSSTSSFSTQ